MREKHDERLLGGSVPERAGRLADASTAVQSRRENWDMASSAAIL